MGKSKDTDPLGEMAKAISRRHGISMSRASKLAEAVAHQIGKHLEKGDQIAFVKGPLFGDEAEGPSRLTIFNIRKVTDSTKVDFFPKKKKKNPC